LRPTSLTVPSVRSIMVSLGCQLSSNI
jgi:hypothetical protein